VAKASAQARPAASEEPHASPKPAPARQRSAQRASSPSPRVAVIPPPPQVEVLQTVWHPSPGRRSARILVEGREEPVELHEGDAVGTLVVKEIQPSGVVFLHLGEELRRPVGSRSR